MRFLPDNLEIEVGEAETILEVASRAGITLRGACGGDGTCGRCLVVLREGAVRDRGGDIVAEPGAVVRACHSFPVGDPVIEVPETSRLREHQVLAEEEEAGILQAGAETTTGPADPLLRRVRVSLAPPEPGETPDDWGRLQAELARVTGMAVRADVDVLRELPAALREKNWAVTVDLGLDEAGSGAGIVMVQAGHARVPVYGVAVDLGTTTVVVELVDLEKGRTVGALGTYNRQAAYGDDVISRIIYAGERSGGRRQLQEAVVDTVNTLIDDLRRRHRIDREAIRLAVCAGNPTMSHLFLGVDPAFIRLEPYAPAANFWPPCRAGELGLVIHPRAPVHVLPGVASYLGGDVTGGVTASGCGAGGEIVLYVDVGTNGEMVLGDGDWLVGCSCSAGPAFEGSGISCGMRATDGAIEWLGVTPGGFEVICRTIGGERPVGICGSGLIAALAGLVRAGVVDRAGRFAAELETPRLRRTESETEFVLAWARETGHGKDVVLTGADIQNLLRAKAAVYAGIRSMLAAVGLEQDQIVRILIAGGFGRFLPLRDAVAIGMLPDVPLERYAYVGNASLRGARAALLSGRRLAGIGETARKITYLELGDETRFMDEFMSAMFIPHTDLDLFPSVQGEWAQ